MKLDRRMPLLPVLAHKCPAYPGATKTHQPVPRQGPPFEDSPIPPDFESSLRCKTLRLSTCNTYRSPTHIRRSTRHRLVRTSIRTLSLDLKTSIYTAPSLIVSAAAYSQPLARLITRQDSQSPVKTMPQDLWNTKFGE
jgi:hypothetical protein